MSVIVPRTCTEILEDDDGRERDARSRPLAAFCEVSAYVLLGDPGAGKSTSFEAECAALGDQAHLVKAREFLTFEPNSRPEWHGKTLFIDGLDEVRAGAGDVRTPFDAIRRNLAELGKPRFRLSCREADWLGTNDRSNLAAISPGSRPTVLRLDPLTDNDIMRIVDAHAGIDDAGTFMATADEKGVGGFLRNPQSLEMLVDVVSGARSWPESRLELFEQACRRMAREHNDEHVAAARSTAGTLVVAGGRSEDNLLAAAGLLCAVQLIGGVAGYAVAASEENGDFPAVDRCDQEWSVPEASLQRSDSRPRQLRGALATKLFSARATGRFSSVHRHVAEFLGARYLARLIGSRDLTGQEAGRGVPARRVLSLLTGHDGIVVTELRGLSAWLVAHSRIARDDLIKQDPIGVGLYGDISRFSPTDKQALLASLQGRVSRIGPVNSTAAAFKALATPDMEPVLRGILVDSNRSDQHQSFAYFVLKILAQGPPLPNLSGILHDIVRDATWRPHINKAAIDAFIHNCPDGPEKTFRLTELLAGVHTGQVSDPDDELLGTLLRRLYPAEVPPSEVWDYFSVPSNQELLGAYWFFWSQVLAVRCSDSQLAEHLDTLVARFEVVRPVLQDILWQRLPVEFLARGLEAHGTGIETKRLYDWLGIGLVSSLDDYPRTGDAARRIRSWLEQHAEIQKAVFAEGMEHCAGSDDDRLDIAASEVWRCLYGSTLPADFGLWCLDQAVAATDARIARYFLERSFGALVERANDDGLSVEILVERTRNHPILAGVFSDLSVCPLDAVYANRQERIRRRQRDQDRRQRGRQKWIDHVRSHEAALRANRGSPRLLHEIALAYFGGPPDVEGNDPLARLASLFGNDGRLIEAALDALRGTILRDDLPEVDEIIRLRDQSKEHYLALPFLAGLAELERSAPDAPQHLDDRPVRTALAFRFCGVSDDEPAWYQQLFLSRPTVVADVLIRCARSEIQHPRRHVSSLYELAHSDAHADVARIASLPLLRAFPNRCATRRMTGLSYLLWSALWHADRGSLLDLIERKLSRVSMNVAQRACWLAAGLVLSPETYLEATERFARSGERRIRHLAEFFDPDRRIPTEALKVPALQLLIRLIGSSFGPWRSHPAGEATRVTPEMSAADRVQWMIRRLAESPTVEAGTALEALASDPSLFLWRDQLLWVRDDQRVIRRDAAYRHPDVDQVCRTLNDGPPANASDLAALVMDRLDEIADRIRNGNTDDWRQYWNEDSHGRPLEPKPENSCRDALLSDLRQCLPDEVDAQPEGQYANDKRADIRISCRDFQVPVEVKKNAHPGLWSALRDQLIGQYVRDPATEGYGIYLVLWFGEVDEDGRKCTPPPPSGVRPDSPGALKARLEEAVTPDEARKISVCVIDVSAERHSSTTPSSP